MAGNTLRLGVQLDDGGVTKKLNGISQQFDKIGGKGSSAVFFGSVAAKGVAAGFNLIGSAVSGLTGFLDGAIHAAIEDQASQAKLQQALENNIPGWKYSTQAINDYIDAQGRLGFSDDEVRDSLGQLIGVTHDATKALDLNSLAQDLARAKGIDLATATDIVTKASLGNGKALKGLGIDIGKTKDAAAILDIVQRNVRGSAETWANTTQGKLQASQVAFNEAVEKIGYTLLPVLSDIMQKFANDWLPALGRGWDKVKAAVKPVADALATVVGWIQKAITWIGRLIQRLKDLNVASIALPPIPGIGPIPHFASGGVVPGALNSPQLIVAHGGERVIPNGAGSGVYIQGVSERDLAEMIDRGLYFRLQRSAPTLSRS